MLSWSSALLGVHRETVRTLARVVLTTRKYSETTPSQSAESAKPHDFLEAPEYTVESFKHLSKSEEDSKKIHLILLELASLRDDTGRAPSLIKDRDISDLLPMSVHQRNRYYTYMFKREMSIRSRKMKKLSNQEARDKEPKTSSEIKDGLFPFIRKNHMHRMLYGKRLAEAALFGQKIVFDCSFGAFMSPRESRNCADQLQLAYAVNKIHPQPFDLTFCNSEDGSTLDKCIHIHFAPFNPAQQLIEKTSKSYLDLFPKEKLVYLSPDASTPMKNWDYDAVYIIGGIVDLGSEKPHTLAKAKKEGIKAMRLPVVEHITLAPGAQKAFTLNAVLSVLLTMRATHDWKTAFRHLPSRFLAQEGQSMTRQRALQRSNSIWKTHLTARSK